MPKLNVGDKVKIINVRNCEYGFNSMMLELVGKKTVITGVSIAFNKNNKLRVRYKIKADGSLYSWSANCFEPIGRRAVMKNE
jgi:hypothetical protein